MNEEGFGRGAAWPGWGCELKAFGSACGAGAEVASYHAPVRNTPVVREGFFV